MVLGKILKIDFNRFLEIFAYKYHSYRQKIPGGKKWNSISGYFKTKKKVPTLSRRGGWGKVNSAPWRGCQDLGRYVLFVTFAIHE